MASPHVSTAFGDLLDPRFQKIFHETLPQLDSMLPEVFPMLANNGREDIRFSEVGTLPDWPEFTGTVTYQSSSQGYDTVLTPIEFASGIQIERKLFDDDQYSIMDQQPVKLATSLARKREGDAAGLFKNAFSVDTTFYVNSEAVPLCSDSHTTNSGASTSIGFDNKSTAALSATAVAANRITMRKFRGDQAERFSVKPDELFIPIDKFEVAFEIVESLGKVDTANNNRNVHKGIYTIKEMEYLTDANDWFMSDSKLRVQMVGWVDRVTAEFAMAEDIDTLVAKWRGYARWAYGHWNWRWILGASVT